MASSGPNSGAHFTNDGTGVAWITPSNAQTSNGVYTTVTAARRMVVDTGNHVSDHFNFAIPAAATIDGIALEIQRKYAGVGGSVTDQNVSLTKDGFYTPYGSTEDLNPWLPTLNYYTWGGPTALWGGSFTPAEINSDNLGVMFSVSVNAGSLAACTAYVDHVRLTVYYTAPDGTHLQMTRIANSPRLTVQRVRH